MTHMVTRKPSRACQLTLSIPHLSVNCPTDAIPRINRETLLAIMDGAYDNQIGSKIIIDCRFAYEYEGGHIQGARNFGDRDLLVAQLFSNPRPGRVLLVFYCEQSIYRAPEMATFVRSTDRVRNSAVYPHLTYPDVLVLDGGYKTFFSHYPQNCTPASYVKMTDNAHWKACKRELHKFEAEWGSERGFRRQRRTSRLEGPMPGRLLFSRIEETEENEKDEA